MYAYQWVGAKGLHLLLYLLAIIIIIIIIINNYYIIISLSALAIWMTHILIVC